MKVRTITTLTFVFCLSALIMPRTVAGQDSPFVSGKMERALNGEISGDRAFDIVRLLTPYHRIMGSRTFVDAAEMLAGLARNAGLENVGIVEQKFEGGLTWDAKSARLWVTEPEEMKVCDFGDLRVSLAVFSRSAHVEAELVDIGRCSADELSRVDVKGKVVLTTASPGLAVKMAVWDRGALGVVSSASVHPAVAYDTPDQIGYIKVPVACPEGKTAPWAFMISARRYGELSALIRKTGAMKKAVRVKADIDTETSLPAKQAFLWGEIAGSEIHDQDIVLTAHLDEESTSANDNGSGCGSLFEVGRAIKALVKEGKVAAPRRDIIFWWPNEHVSEYQYIRENPEAPKGWLAAINQDMVGARQSLGSRIQHIMRTPYSLPSYLSDVIESIAESVILGNNGFLATEEAGRPQPFSKPLLSFRGSRERYGAMVVPHSGASDQEVFCDARIRVPGIGMINNPDFYIHSSDDDLQNIDATQLKRNAYIVAAATLFLASAGDGDAPMISGEVFSRGVKRLGLDLNAAIGWVRDAGTGDAARAYWEARNLVEQAAEREKLAVESVLVFTRAGGPNAAFVKARAARILEIGLGLRRDLDAFYLELTGAKRLPAESLTDEEKAMSTRVPENVGTLDEYFEKRGWSVEPMGLHPIMAKECYCFVDGKRSCLDIYRAVLAENMSAGEFYYGRVTPAAVRGLLDEAVAKGVLKLK